MRQTRNCHVCSYRVPLFIACAFLSLSAFGYSRFAKWDTAYSSSFPVIRTYGCPNQFARFFTTPWGNNILYNALSAMEEWFVDGGADLRMRYFGDLPASDGRCLDSASDPNNGEILITAERNNGSGYCYAATTRWWNDGSHMIKARLVIHSGTVCRGFYEPYDWATNADYPTGSQFDFWSVFLHEFGHAIGFDHSTDSDAVMFTDAPRGDNQKRWLAFDDRSGLFDQTFGYAKFSASPKHILSPNDGALWGTHPEQIEVNYSTIGTPGVCYHAALSNPFLVIHTSAFNNQLFSYLTDGINFYGEAQIHNDWSFAPPAVGCSNTRFSVAFLGWPQREQYIYTKYSDDGINRSDSLLNGVGAASSLRPAVAFANFANRYVLAFADRWSGRLRTMTSSDGLIYGNLQTFDSIRTSNQIGITCQDSGAYCSLTWSDGNFFQTPLSTAVMRFDVSGNLYIESMAGLGYYSYGGSVASNSGRFEYVWRDGEYSTGLTSGGWPWPPVLDTINFTIFRTHSPPILVWNSRDAQWTAWFTYDRRYDHF